MTVKTIKAVAKKDGKTGDRAWTNYMVEFTDGLKASSFDPGVATLRAGDTFDFDIAKNDKGYWELNEWKEPSNWGGTDGGPSPTQELPATVNVPHEVWDAKDRATYMESAYKSASRLFQGMGGAKANRVEYIRLARWIYWDIRNARDDKSLQAIPRED